MLNKEGEDNILFVHMIIFVFFFVCVRHRRYVLSFVNKNFIDRIGVIEVDAHELDNFIDNQKEKTIFSFVLY